jgi:hypothetical protein
LWDVSESLEAHDTALKIDAKLTDEEILNSIKEGIMLTGM